MEAEGSDFASLVTRLVSATFGEQQESNETILISAALQHSLKN